MPFKSIRQREFMYANHPEIAKRWEEETPKDAKLPEHVRDVKHRRGKIRSRKDLDARLDALFDH